jgi:ABC-type xylose transport system permease subunit
MSKQDLGICLAIGIVLCLIPSAITWLVGAIFLLISWIGALIAVAKKEAWGWFVGILLLPALGTLIYSLAGPSD